MKLRLSFLVCVVAGALFAPTALAQKPVIEPYMPEPLEFSAGTVCPFAVRIETVSSKASIKTFPDGRQLTTGRTTDRVTNLITGESVDLTGAGSILSVPLPNGDLRLIGRGRILIYLFPGDVGGPALIRVTGRVEETLNLGTDTITSFRLSGKRMDVCAALAP